MQEYQEFLEEILIDEETLQNRIAELGQEISRDYRGEHAKRINLAFIYVYL